MTWNLKITNENAKGIAGKRNVIFGISQTPTGSYWNECDSCFTDTKYDGDAYGYRSWNGNKDTSLYGGSDSYGPPWFKGDIIEMTLDMTGKVYGTLSYKVNGTDLGTAFDYINIGLGYRMTVCVTYNDDLKLLQNPKSGCYTFDKTSISYKF